MKNVEKLQLHQIKDALPKVIDLAVKKLIKVMKMEMEMKMKMVKIELEKVMEEKNI